MAPLHKDHLAVKLAEWADALISLPDAATELTKITSVNLDDLRVREFVEAETRANRNFMAMGMDILALKAILQVYTDNLQCNPCTLTPYKITPPPEILR